MPSPTSSRRARPRRRPSRRSRPSGSSRTATRRRSSLPTAASAGFASRASTHRVSSRRCWTGRPATSASGPSASTCRRLAPTSRHQHARDDLADPGRVGRRARRTDARAAGRRGHRHAPYPAARRRGRRPHAGAHDRVHRGPRRDGVRLRAGVRLRPRARRMGDAGRRSPHRRRARRRADAATEHLVGDRAGGRSRPRPPYAARRRARVLRALVGGGSRLARGRRGRARADGRHHALLALLAGRRAAAGPPLARADPAFRADRQGLDLHADRRDPGRGHDVAARDAGRRAQLGLPRRLDARLDVHAAGAALAQPRLGGGGVHAVPRRPRARRRRLDADHVRDRRSPRPDRVRARRPLRLRGRAPRADRQRRLRPAPERRLRRGAGLHPAAYPPQPAHVAADVADHRQPGGVRDPRLARPRPGDLGGTRRAASLRLLEAHVLGRDGPRRQARRDPRRRGASAALA